MTVLVTAATRHGATAEIAEAIGRVLRRGGLDVAVIAPDDVGDIGEYDAVVLGSAVYSGHWLTGAKGLVDRYGGALAARPVWLFSSGPVGEPSRKLVQKMGADPLDLAAVREKKHLSRPQRAALTVFRGLEGDFRDWAEIEQWASGIADAFRSPT